MRLRPLLAGGGMVAVLALALLAGGADPSSAGTFNPTLEVTVDDPTPEATSDFTVDFGIPAGDTQFGGVVSFIPLEWGIVKGDAIPIGAAVGFLDSKATLGLINASCSTSIPVHFDFQNASLNTADTVAYLDPDENGTPDFAEDKDANGLKDAVDKYPDFLTRVFPDKQPLRRSAGITLVAGLPILLQFLIFPPGTDINENIPHDVALGYPSVVVLTNAGDNEAEPIPGAITDFCAPLTSTNVSAGKGEDGSQLYVNPQNGKYEFVTVAVGLRDADGDGYENALDTCPLEPNVGDPTIPGDGDSESDGLDAACDPNDNEVNSDEDLDGYLNRQDNCPLKANGQAQDKASPGPEETNQADGDLDQIGDACDQAPDTPDGDLSVKTLKAAVTIGDGTGAGGPPSNCADCYKPGETGNGGTPSEGGDGGSDTGLIIGIIVGVIAAVAVLGGGAFFLMRRSGGA